MKRMIRLLPLLLLFLMGAGQQPDREVYLQDVHDNLIRFGEVYRNLAFRYVDQINPEAAMNAAIRGLLDELDPYSDYFIEEAAQELDDMSRGQYGGIGMEVGLRGSEKRITVISPFEGSPSWKAGLKPGDEITRVDSVDVTGKPLSDVVRLIKGAPGSPVTMGIRRSGSREVKDYTLVRELINIQDVKLAELVDPATGTGYVRLVRFSGLAGENLATAIEELKAKGLKRLVLDLRGNPGGLLREAAAVSELFLPKGTPIVVTRGRNNELIKEIRAERDPVFTGELVVLVDGGSASASEIVAGCLQDHDRALIVGQQSFGKGLVQSVLDLDEEAKMKLTTARYYLPSGRLIQRIDYFEKNEVLDHVADSTLADTLFHTEQGRPVISGRGITPDVEVKPERQSWLAVELWRANQFADFVDDRSAAGALPADASGTSLLADFRAYLNEKEFKYQPRGSVQLDELKKILEEERVGPEGAKALESMRAALGDNLPQQFKAHEDELAQLLDLELIDHRAGQAARSREALKQDQVFQQALQLLSGKGEYRRALGLQGT
ncbi:MAG: S41 family peptidase [Candidatus Delongbacteria bacterium]